MTDSVFKELLERAQSQAVRAVAEQQRRAMTHLVAPLQFAPPTKDDGLEIRMRSYQAKIEYAPRYYCIGVDWAHDCAPDPLDATTDGVTLRKLLADDEHRRRNETRANAHAATLAFTAAQRAAVSAHWSAELRALVAAAKERDRNVVRVDLQDEP